MICAKCGEPVELTRILENWDVIHANGRWACQPDADKPSPWATVELPVIRTALAEFTADLLTVEQSLRGESCPQTS